MPLFIQLLMFVQLVSHNKVKDNMSIAHAELPSDLTHDSCVLSHT